MMDDLPAPNRRAFLHSQLDELLDLQEEFHSADPSEEGHFGGWATSLVQHAAAFARIVCAPGLIEEALGNVESGSRYEVLRSIELQLSLASALFDQAATPKSDASIGAATEEIRAIMSGDEPRLFARMDGRKTPYRVAKAKLQAIGWDQYLEARGEPPYLRHARIAVAFGHEWDTISRWRADVVPYLGEQHVLRSLRDMVRQATPGFRVFGSPEEDGRKYRRAMGFRVVGSDEKA